jgi:hypothetical protein
MILLYCNPARSFRAVEFLLLAPAVYLSLSLLLTSLLRWIEGRMERRPSATGIDSQTLSSPTATVDA